ncbi:hypothetical protein [Plantactinospora sp. WMMB782]|uniref:hypothetical protein n=1 Tax=Plantactinospora sp. WMMB782 TaxID=3404121 RepID=UPI003B95FA92
MNWLKEVIAHLGEPRFAYPDGVRLGDRHRRCWVWFADEVNHNVAIDRSGRWTEVHAGGKGGHVRLTLANEPNDAQMHAVCTLVGLLPEVPRG